MFAETALHVLPARLLKVFPLLQGAGLCGHKGDHDGYSQSTFADGLRLCWDSLSERYSVLEML